MKLNRRTFNRLFAACGIAVAHSRVQAQTTTGAKLRFGVCTGPNHAAKLKGIGYDFLEGGVAKTLMPDLDDNTYAPELAKLKACGLPFHSCNGFLPGHFRLTGPEANHGPALDYAEIACRRADELGINFIVLGSSRARNVPDGFSHDRAKEQFIAFCQALGERIKDRKVTIVLEPLNKKESNLLNKVEEGIEYVDAINRPRIQLLADFFHMMMENEGPESIVKAGSRIRHCHIAELEKRMAPGTSGEDLTRYFKALHTISYVGGVSCECGWPKENTEEAWKKALATMRTQASA